MRRAIAGLVLLTACASLPHEESYPRIEPYMLVGAGVDVTGQVLDVPWPVRVGLVAVTGGVVRYSKCCGRPEGVHLGIGLGGLFVEILGIAIRGRP